MDSSSQFQLGRGSSVGRAPSRNFSRLVPEILKFFSSRLSACCHFRQNQNLRLIKPERENFKMKLKR